MKKLFLITLALGFAIAMANLGSVADNCFTIKDGVIKDTKGALLNTGFDQWGYNYQSHMFNGLYWNYSRPDPPWTEETLIAAGMSTTWLVMKWNDAWLSNKDCDGDYLLDRHYGYASYIGSGAWETNHQSGTYEAEVKGKWKTIHWNYFVKIISPPSDAYKELNEDGVLMWYGADDVEIGSDLWGQHARVQRIYTDPLEVMHGPLYLSPTSPGFGYYSPEK